MASFIRFQIIYILNDRLGVYLFEFPKTGNLRKIIYFVQFFILFSYSTVIAANN